MHKGKIKADNEKIASTSLTTKPTRIFAKLIILFRLYIHVPTQSLYIRVTTKLIRHRWNLSLSSVLYIRRLINELDFYKK